MQFPPITQPYTPQIQNFFPQINNEEKIDPVAAAECTSCANRYYQDSSNDGGVSMQQPTRIHPNEAASAVMAHEREHQSREAHAAHESGREVVSNTVRFHSSLCPECGRSFISGGETRTTTRAKDDDSVLSFEDAFSNLKI
jgi:predicted RNA-binding Zn-ribbon protein involved in translation (DUF1610 family)